MHPRDEWADCPRQWACCVDPLRGKSPTITVAHAIGDTPVAALRYGVNCEVSKALGQIASVFDVPIVCALERNPAGGVGFGVESGVDVAFEGCGGPGISHLVGEWASREPVEDYSVLPSRVWPPE
jgi:hypothetical protein